MNKEEFLSKFQDVLQKDEALTMEMNLADIPEWDSLAVLSTCLFLNENGGKALVMEDIAGLKTVADIGALLGL